MVQQLSKTDQTEIVYPDSDGQPMSDNTLQFNWIVTIKENLESLYADDPNVFVAGDLLWYPVEGSNTIRQAPDTMVAFGRPKGYRGSYMQWKEDNIAPQIVFEVLSPGNRMGEMKKKFNFYQQYGVQEYYVYDPYDIELIGWQRENQHLGIIENTHNWVSPLLKIKFVITPDDLEIYHPNGEPFISLTTAKQKIGATEQERDAVKQERDAVKQERDAVKQERDAVKQERNAVKQERDAARDKADRLAARLKALGIDPEDA